ncbi:hypothetical protein LCGC14_0580710 [marine sediment metagenome]|uniref:Uncharacterized protein n=1 Tax=marine sediment metagenome TaxID=412755 RepID=A0A0F9RLH3_9ZZZZ
MSFFLPKTVEGVRRQKERFMLHWTTATNPQMKQVYEQAINGCDRLTARIIAKSKRRLGLLLILLCLSLVQGCQTVKGVTGDAGWILTELSDNISTK